MSLHAYQNSWNKILIVLNAGEDVEKLDLIHYFERSEYVMPLPAGLHHFFWELSCWFYWGYLVSGASFFLLLLWRFSQLRLLKFLLWCVCLWLFLHLSYLKFFELPGCIGYCVFSINLRHFQPFFPWTIRPSPFSFPSCIRTRRWCS